MRFSTCRIGIRKTPVNAAHRCARRQTDGAGLRSLPPAEEVHTFAKDWLAFISCILGVSWLAGDIVLFDVNGSASQLH